MVRITASAFRISPKIDQNNASTAELDDRFRDSRHRWLKYTIVGSFLAKRAVVLAIMGRFSRSVQWFWRSWVRLIALAVFRRAILTKPRHRKRTTSVAQGNAMGCRPNSAPSPKRAKPERSF
jgi:hypothetical protein